MKLPSSIAALVALVCLSTPSRADPSTPFGVGNSQVGIFCPNAGGTAWVACGTTANPFVVTSSSGGSLTANQGTPALVANAWPVLAAPTADATMGITPIVAGSSASSAVLKASAGNLYSVYATNTGASDGWLMVFNATSLPGNAGTTAGTASGNLQDCIKVPAGTSQSINYNPGPPEPFTVGITAVFSSTSCGTLTASANAFIHGSAK